MLPLAKERPRGAGERPGRRRATPPRQSCRVLAERTQTVAPVGVWVERAPRHPEEIPAFASALRVEEELREQHREKAANLRRFQGEVKQRVTRQVRMRRAQQLQKSREAVERESRIAVQYSDPALRLIPGKNTCLFWSHLEPAVCHRGPCAVPAQHHGPQGDPFQQQAAELSKTVKQVRLRLASCKTLPRGAGPPELPGGVWRREKPEVCWTAAVPARGESEELRLAGHHDLPAELQDGGTAPRRAERDDDFYVKIEFEKFRAASVKDSSSPAPSWRPHTDDQAPLMLWAGVDQEQAKKQRQNEYLRRRRLFMRVEREQVKERRRRRRIAEIKSKKENQSRAEERRVRETAEWQEPSLGEGACETAAQLKLEERRAKRIKEKQRNKEHARYVEALRAQVRENMKLHNIALPPLCSCGSDFWDCHPDTCANNCAFYKNHKAYSRALQSVISSCDAARHGPSATSLLRGLAALCARSGKHL